MLQRGKKQSAHSMLPGAAQMHCSWVKLYCLEQHIHRLSSMPLCSCEMPCCSLGKHSAQTRFSRLAHGFFSTLLCTLLGTWAPFICTAGAQPDQRRCIAPQHQRHNGSAPHATDHSLPSFVQGTMLSALAVLWKRSWLDLQDGQRQELFAHVQELAQRGLAAPGGNPAFLSVALQLLSTVVAEFGGTRGGAGGLRQSLAFHKRTAQAFRDSGLDAALQLTAGTLQVCAAKLETASAAVHLPDQAVALHAQPGLPAELASALQAATQALGCLVEIIEWDFSTSRGVDSTGAAGAEGDSTGVHDPVQFPVHWAPVLYGHDGLLAHAVKIYLAARWVPDSQAASLAMQCLTALLSAAGPVVSMEVQQTMCQAMLLLLARRMGASEAQRTCYPGLGSLRVSLDVMAGALCAMGGSAVPVAHGADASTSAVALGAGHAHDIGRHTAGDVELLTPLLASEAQERHQLACMAASLMTAQGLRGLSQVPQFPRVVHSVQAMHEAAAQARGVLTTAAAALLNAPASNVGLAAWASARESVLDARGACEEACNVLLQAWSSWAEAWACPGLDEQPLPESARALHPVCSQLYLASVESRLMFAEAVIRADEDDDQPFEDKSVLDDAMTALAMLGRVDIARSAPMLASQLAHACEQLRSAPEPALPLLQERIWWLLMFSGYLLCDAGKGEQPTIPPGVMQSSARLARAHASPGDDPAVVLALRGLELLGLHSEALSQASGADMQRLSPLLAEQLLWWTGRWSASYLLPRADLYKGQSVPATLATAFGTTSAALPGSELGMCPSAAQLLHSGAMGVLQHVLQGAVLHLLCWPAEPGVAGNAINVLFALAKARRAAAALSDSVLWVALVHMTARVIQADCSAGTTAPPTAGVGHDVGGLATQLQRVAYLPSRLQAVLTQAVCCWLQHADPERQLQVWAPLAGALLARAQSLQAATPAQLAALLADKHSQAAREVARILQHAAACAMHGPSCPASAVASTFGGVDCSALPALGDSVWLAPAFMAVLACPQLFHAVQGRGPVAAQCLQTLSTVAEAQLDFLDGEPAVVLLRVAAQVFQAAGKHLRGTLGKGAGMDEEEAVAMLQAVLQLLQQIVQKSDFDWVGSSDTAGPSSKAVAGEALVLGLQLLAPLMSAARLDIPGLAQAYMECLAHGADAHAAGMASMAPDVMHHVLSAISTCLASPLPALSVPAATALAELWEWHRRNLAEGGAGLTTHLHAHPQITTRLMREAFMALLTPQSSASGLAPALAPLILTWAQSDAAQLEQMLQYIVDSAVDDAGKARSAAAVQTFIAAIRKAATGSRAARLGFRDELHKFIADVRTVTVVI